MRLYSTTLKGKLQEEGLNSRITGNFPCAPRTILKDLPLVDLLPHITMITLMIKANLYPKFTVGKRQIMQAIGHHPLTSLKKAMTIITTKMI